MNSRREVPVNGTNQRNQMDKTTNRMKRTATFFLTALLLAPLAVLHAADESAPDVIRVACVGDSTTQ